MITITGESIRIWKRCYQNFAGTRSLNFASGSFEKKVQIIQCKQFFTTGSTFWMNSTTDCSCFMIAGKRTVLQSDKRAISTEQKDFRSRATIQCLQCSTRVKLKVVSACPDNTLKRYIFHH